MADVAICPVHSGGIDMLLISKNLLMQIQSEAEKAYPNECCGFLFGSIRNSEKFAEHTQAVVNASSDEEQYHRFVITPEDMLKAERFARKQDYEIIGFYHSHPDCPAVPSGYDTAHALPVYSYIIVSVMQGRASDLRSWELDKAADYKEFASETIVKGVM